IGLVDLRTLGGCVWPVFQLDDGQRIAIVKDGLRPVDRTGTPDQPGYEICGLRVADVGNKVLLQQFGESRNAATPQTVRSLRGHHGGIEQSDHATASTSIAAAWAWSQASRSGMGCAANATAASASSVTIQPSRAWR